MTVEELRKEFPQLSEQVYGRDLVYLDNAATSLKPASTVRELSRMTTVDNANIYRAVHSKAVSATAEFEKARDRVKEFIGASCREEIIFTSGTTASINLLANSFSEAFINEGDEIIISEAEHHADIVPWQLMCSRRKAVIRVLPIDDNGAMRVELLEGMITPRTKLVCVSHISNVLGIINPVGRIIQIAHSRGCPVLVDGAQGIVHTKVDVRELDCDFYAFSGHKIFASTGTGVLYGKKKWLDAMPPYMGGGEMISEVKWSGTGYAPLPLKFEAGTQNIAGICTFIPALELAEATRCREIEENQRMITACVSEALESNPYITLYGKADTPRNRIPLFSFTVKGAHHEDLALILDKMGIAVRSGQQCAEPLMDRLGVTGVLRASFGACNTVQEAEYFLKSLDRAIKMLL